MTKTNMIRIYFFSFWWSRMGTRKVLLNQQAAQCCLLGLCVGGQRVKFLPHKTMSIEVQTNCVTSSEMELIWMSFYSGLMMNEFVPQMCHWAAEFIYLTDHSGQSDAWLALPRTSGVNKEQLKPDGVTCTHLVANLIDAYSCLNSRS